jgi:hypothetical protein
VERAQQDQQENRRGFANTGGTVSVMKTVLIPAMLAMMGQP